MATFFLILVERTHWATNKFGCWVWIGKES